jgi:transcriptional regulator with XRE-family HTH domain
MNKTFGAFLKELRDNADLSLRELAAEVGVSAAFLSDVELGRRFPSEDKLALLAKKLKVSVEELKRHDFREEAENIKKLMFADPTVGLAFRTVHEKIKGGLSPEEVVKRLRGKK